MHEVSGEISFYAGPRDCVQPEEDSKTMRILIADDQPSVRSAIRLLLDQQPERHSFAEVADAQELLDGVTNRCFDVVLLDWELPGTAPGNLVARLRALCPDVFTVILDTKPQTRQLAFRAGAGGFVCKNDPPECLLAAVNRPMLGDHTDK